MTDSDFRVDAYNPHSHRRSEWKRFRDLKNWQQGDVIANIPMTWIGPAGDDLLTGVGALNPPMKGPVYADDLLAEHAIVVTQTCDLMWKPPGDRRPFAQVCPVMPAAAITNENIRRDALNKNTTYYYPVKIDGASYVADLRITVPVSKALLLESDKVATLTDFERHELGEMLGLLYRRPALPDQVSEDLNQAIAAFVASNRDRSFITNVEQVRIEITRPRFYGEQARLHIFGRDRTLDHDEQAEWRSNDKSWKGILKPSNITLQTSLFTNPSQCTALLYRQTHHLNLPGLGPSPD